MADLDVKFKPSNTPSVDIFTFRSEKGYMQGVAGPAAAIGDQFGSENNIARWKFLRSLDAPIAWVDRITVNKEFRNRGYGTDLLRQAFQVLRESGIRYIVLSPRPEKMEDIERLDRFYKKFGFKEVREFEGERLWNTLLMVDLAITP